MVVRVMEDLQHFLVLFLIFVLTFAECYHQLGVDVAAYGSREADDQTFVAVASHILATLRSAMGDFALIDMLQGFDLYAAETTTRFFLSVLFELAGAC